MSEGQKAGEDVGKSVTSAPSKQPSTTMKKQSNGGGASGGGDAGSASTSSGARKGPTQQQIELMASPAKGKKNGRGGKKNGYTGHPTHLEEPVGGYLRRGRGGCGARAGGRGGVPRPNTQYQQNVDDDDQSYYQPHYSQRGNNRGNYRGNPNPRKTGPDCLYSPRSNFEHNIEDYTRHPDSRRGGRGRGFSNARYNGRVAHSSSTSLPTAPSEKHPFSRHDRKSLESCVSQFITPRPRPVQPTNKLSKDNPSSPTLDLQSFFAAYKDDTAAGRAVSNISAQLRFPISFDKIQVPGVVSKASTSDNTASVTTAPVLEPMKVPVPDSAPPKAPVPKPRTRSLLSRNGSCGSTESLSQHSDSEPTTPRPEPEAVPTSSSSIDNAKPVPVPMLPTSVSASSTSITNNTTQMHSTPTAVTVSAPVSSSSSCRSQSSTSSLLQLLEERQRKEQESIDQKAAQKPVPRPRPALPPRSLPNGVSNHNDPNPRSPRGPPAHIIEQQKRLPIYSVKKELMKMINKYPVTIVIGDPGSGKSTQLPQYLLEAGFSKNGKIGVTEPRRVAAKTLAERVAYEVGQPVGSTVGYAVRFERKMSGRTVIKYMTDGVLIQDCANPAHLEEYSVIIIDEAHERSVHTDICFGLLKREAERAGSKLKIIISSATLEQEKFSEYFGAPVFLIPGNAHEPKIVPYPEGRGHVKNYLEEAVNIIKGINHKTNFSKGDILVFLSGQDEIEELTRMLNGELEKINRLDSQLCILQCYGALTFNEQMRIFDPAPENRRKVILATNIAETSITIEGVVYVIDCGYFKESFYNPENGINYLVKKRITKFQAAQRQGRASRTEEGICFRVYSERDLDEMEETGAPEITRCNLEAIILDLAAMGIGGWDFDEAKGKMTLTNFDLMDLPAVDAFIEALTHLKQFSAVEVDGTGIKITELGELMSSFHLDPSLSRVLIESMRLGCEQEVLKIVALLSANYSNLFYGHSACRDTLEMFYHPDGDLLTFLNIYNAWLENGRRVDWCRTLNLQHRIFQEAEDIRSQIQSILKRLNERNPQQGGLTSRPAGSHHENIRKSFVAGYFRQFAFKKPSGPAYRHLANVATQNEDIYLHPSSVFCNCGPPTPPQWIIYNAMLVTSKPYMRAVTVINPEWIWEYAPEFAKNLAKMNVLEPQEPVPVPPLYQENDDTEIEAWRQALEC